MRTSRLALLSFLGMFVAAGVTYACTPSGGFSSSAASEIAAFEPLEIDASWLRGAAEPEPATLGFAPTTVPVAAPPPAPTIVPVARPVKSRPLSKVSAGPKPQPQERMSKTSFATPPRAPRQEPLLSSARSAPPPQPPPVQVFPQMPRMAFPVPGSTARPVSTGSF